MVKDEMDKSSEEMAKQKGAPEEARAQEEKVKPEGAGEDKEMATIPLKEYEALNEAKRERDSYRDKYLRVHAEFENARKRLERERREFYSYAHEGFVTEFLPILDSLEMASKHMNEKGDLKAVRRGMEMIHQEVQKFIGGLGVVRIKTLGEKFNPHLHEAIEVIESDDKEENSIIEELKAGYTLNGKLLRPVGVKISRKKDKGKKT